MVDNTDHKSVALGVSGAAVVTSVTLNEKLIDSNQDPNANERLEEIILDHSLAKSSNVSSPKEPLSLNSSPQIALNPQREALESPTKQISTNSVEISPIKSTFTLYPDPIKRRARYNGPFDIEDDFFSMAYSSIYAQAEKPKKKKKKNKRKDTLETPESKSSLSTIKQKATASSPILLDSTPEKGNIPEDDVVLINEIEPIIKTKTEPLRKRRALTPPPIDEDEIRKRFLQKKTSYEEDSFSSAGSNNYNLKARLARLGKVTQQVAAENNLVKRSSTAESLSDDEKNDREYLLRLTSYLPGSADHAIDMTVKGSKKVSTVVKKALSYLLDMGIVSIDYHHLYNTEAVTLFWKDLMLVQFMRIESLNIPVPLSGQPTVVEIGIYTNSQARELIEMKKRKEREKLEKFARDEALERELKKKDETIEIIDPFRDDEDFKEIDQEIRPSLISQHNQELQEQKDGEEGGYFSIGIKSQDNIKIEVSVKPETLIKDLVKYYLKKKGLPEHSKVRLSFDDEDIDLNGTVGDTELEEDFTVEVYVLSET